MPRTTKADRERSALFEELLPLEHKYAEMRKQVSGREDGAIDYSKLNVEDIKERISILKFRIEQGFNVKARREIADSLFLSEDNIGIVSASVA